MNNEQPQLHTAIVSMVSLAAGIASNHPAMGQCQLERLRGLGVPENQIDAVIEIARHIRDEAAQKLDVMFDQAAAGGAKPEPKTDEVCCTSTTSGQSCC